MVRFRVTHPARTEYIKYPKRCRNRTVTSVQLFEISSVENSDPASSLFNSCPKFHGKKTSLQKFETSLRDRSKAPLPCCECQGVWNFAKECPAQQIRRGKSKNSPGKGNPTESSSSQGAMPNLGYELLVCYHRLRKSNFRTITKLVGK